MLRTGHLIRPASTPTSRPTPGASLPGTLASPRTGLSPAGSRELSLSSSPEKSSSLSMRPSFWTHPSAATPRSPRGQCPGPAPTGAAPRSPWVIVHLAVCFMTRGDLHDRRAGGRNSEPYGLSIFPWYSIGVRQIHRTTAGRTRTTRTSKSGGFCPQRGNPIAPPPGKTGRWEGDPEERPALWPPCGGSRCARSSSR
jgi:hypothetical protein